MFAFVAPRTNKSLQHEMQNPQESGLWREGGVVKDDASYCSVPVTLPFLLSLGQCCSYCRPFAGLLCEEEGRCRRGDG